MSDTEATRRLLEAAADLWEDRGESFDPVALADASGTEASEIRNRFRGTGELFDAFYADLTTRAGENLSQLPDDMLFEERVGAFCFMTLDLLEERLPFAQATFEGHAARWGSPFRKEVTMQLRGLLGAPDVPGVNQMVLETEPGLFVVVEIYVSAVRAWLSDETQGRERAAALLDKLVGLFGATASNQTLERGIDVLRYVVTAGYLPRIPFLSDWLAARPSNDPTTTSDVENPDPSG